MEPDWSNLHLLVEVACDPNHRSKRVKKRQPETIVDAGHRSKRAKSEALLRRDAGWMEVVFPMDITGNPKMVMEKSMTESDRNEGLNRFLIPKGDAVLKNLMSPSERESMVVGKEGLEVLVLDRLGRGYMLWLKRWKSGAVVFNGPKWREFVRDNGWTVGKFPVQLWAFRYGEDGRLGFVLLDRKEGEVLKP
ncbi:hypothetical protein QJS10_CPB14g01323 [Acorus calamus]|uniref:TF-B3 domain-containing protein n=1 Tax=Acorus calamus TaxID=4465 RepID=A0AAV9DBM3_ACOCL|nr:hypothetical protein QJS10_CPB14g01323 [Acorus calamus]